MGVTGNVGIVGNQNITGNVGITGNVKATKAIMTNLIGSGTRMLITDANGEISSQAMSSFSFGNSIMLGGSGSGEIIERTLPDFGLSFKTGFAERLKITNSGNVGIGVANIADINQKLVVDGNVRVNGKIAAKEVIVNPNASFPDYVFENNYTKLNPDDIENYVLKYKHLPYIKSAYEINKDGINIAELQIGLLRHIEEMYLTIIELQKRIRNLEK